MSSVAIVEMVVIGQEQGRNVPSTLGGGAHHDEEGENSNFRSGVKMFEAFQGYRQTNLKCVWGHRCD